MKIAITDLLELDKSHYNELEQLGYELTRFSRKDIYEGDADVVVGMQIPKDTVPENLKFVQLTSAGYDHLDMSVYRKSGVIISNGRGMYSVPIAEYCIAHILRNYKNVERYMHQQETRTWKRLNNSKSLDKAKVLMMGTGSIAEETAKRLKAFNATVDGLNSNGRPLEHFDTCYALKDLEKHLPHYDIVICSLPSNESTYHVMGRNQFKMMKEDAIFINVGRGACVDLDGLMEVLDSHLSEVILDVFEEEPLPESHPFWNHPKAVLTPHASSETNLLNTYRLEIIMENLRRYARHEDLINRVL